MKNKKLLFSMLLILIGTSIFAQQDANKITEKYIVIDNIDDFFQISEDRVTCNPIVHNITDNESAKPYHIKVNELKNVIKFSMKSHSEEYENQRKCKLIINKNNYKNTFISSLIAMEVTYIYYNKEYLTLEQFYSYIK